MVWAIIDTLYWDYSCLLDCVRARKIQVMNLFSSMKIYTVHIKPGMANASQRPVFVREGFNIWAFLFTVLWALYHRLWLPALLMAAFNTLLLCMLKEQVLNQASIGAIHLGFHAVIGFWGNDWLRARLTRRGYILADITASDNLLRAEQRYFERILSPAANA